MLDVIIPACVIDQRRGGGGNIPASQAAPEIPIAWAMRKPKGWEPMFWWKDEIQRGVTKIKVNNRCRNKSENPEPL